MGTKLFFAGDFLISNEISEQRIIDASLKQELDKCDIVCCNFEGPIVEKAKKMKKIGPNIKNNKNNAKKLIEDGFNLFCLANNHIYDYGKQGIEETINFLKSRKVDFIGANINNDIYKEYIKEINGIKIGILNYAENGFGAATENDDYGYAYMLNYNVKEKIIDIKKQVDKLIIVVHAGAENWDVPLPEIRNLYKDFIDVGADVIIGHHPHVPQGIEKYNNGLIVYSLGNFAFDIGDGPRNNHTYSIIINIIDKNNIEYEIIPIIFENQIIKIDNTDFNILNKKFKILNEYLKNDDEYKNVIEDKCIEFYNKYYINYYKKASCIYKGNIKERLKGIIKKFITKNGFQNIWLYHNISIETHYWICKRALKLLLKKDNIL